jgi:hypothetical protein
MNKQKFNKIVLATAYILFVGFTGIAKDKLPLWKDAQEKKAIEEVLNYLKEKEAIESLSASLSDEKLSVKVLDLEGNLLKEASFEGDIDWSTQKDLRNLIGRSDFVVEHQKTMYYVFAGETKDQVRS